MTSFRDIKRRKLRSTKEDEAFVERLRELLEYDPETGELFWKRRPVGCENSCGYLKLGVDGRQMTVHRIAFALMTGALPTHEIDHKNRNRSDNRWENLREMTRHQNALNTGMFSTNTSGFKGVSWNKNSGAWRAKITVNSKLYHLGYFSSPEEAGEAYEDAKQRLYGDFL